VFTGIIEELGTVESITLSARSGSAASHAGGPGTGGSASARLAVRAKLVTADTKPGDSISVNGTCLTVVDADSDQFAADVIQETLARTTLGGLRAGDRVNLERAATLATRLGGHLVQGHVDGVGAILAREPGDRWETVRFSVSRRLAGYMVEKGSITVDGVSLTVTGVGQDWFEVGLIPTTLALTTLGFRAVGDPVNLEVDVIAKYVERLLAGGVS
jgi:riboflavin synthase